MENQDSWLGRIIRKTRRVKRLKLDKGRVEATVKKDRKDPATRAADEPRDGQGSGYKKTNYGLLIHVSFQKEHLLHNPYLIEVLDPVTRRMRRIDTSKPKERTTGFYKGDGSLIND